MPTKKDVKWHARRSKKEPRNDPTGDQTARHSESGGAQSGRGSLDLGQSRHEGVEYECVMAVFTLSLWTVVVLGYLCK